MTALAPYRTPLRKYPACKYPACKYPACKYMAQSVARQLPWLALAVVLCWTALTSFRNLVNSGVSKFVSGRALAAGFTLKYRRLAPCCSPRCRCSVSWVVLICWIAFANGQTIATEVEAFDVAQVDIYLAEPFTQLAERLEQIDRGAQAKAVRAWIPVRHSDAKLAFFFDKPDPTAWLNDPEAAEAFDAARRESSRRAFQGAIRSAEKAQPELAFELIWRSYREEVEPSEASRVLGLPGGSLGPINTRTGRDAPQGLGWPPRSFLVTQSKHFQIFSTAPRRETVALAEDLERFYQVWAQVFLTQWTRPEELAKKIAQKQSLELPERVCNIVLFGDRDAYSRALSANERVAQQSTGFYSPDLKLTLLFAGPESDPETRYHELTHQLLQEVSTRAIESPGAELGFWFIEGIASYMESTQFYNGYASVGGWQAPRLQYSRARYLVNRDAASLETFMNEGRAEFQKRDDLAETYSLSTAYSHLLMDDPSLRPLALEYLSGLYTGRDRNEVVLAAFADQPSNSKLIKFLELSDQPGTPLRYPDTQTIICLNRCKVDRAAISSIPPQTKLTWLDLGFLDVDAGMVRKLLSDGKQLQRLNLEATKIDDTIAELLANHRDLEELDLSLTSIGDPTLASIRGFRSLETLWLTGTKISDDSIPHILTLKNLRMLDVQRTLISEQGLERLRISRPEINLNPLELVH